MAKSAIALQKKRQEDAISEMSPELKKVYKKIKAKAESVQKNVVMAMYEVGEHVQEVTRNERRYGEAAVPTLALALGKQWSDNQLWDYRALVNAFTKKQIEKMLSQETAGGNTIKLTHLKKLSGLSAAKRKTMTRRVFEEDLTTDELADAILSRAGGKKRSGGGRKPQAPKTITSGLNQIAKYPAEVGNRVKIWDAHVFNKVEKLSPDDCNSELLSQLKATRAAEQLGVGHANHIIQRLSKAIARVESVMSKKTVKTVKKKASSNGAPKKKSAKKKAVAKKKVVKKKPVSAKDRIAAAKKKRRPVAS